MNKLKKGSIERAWWSKSISGAVLGFTFALGCTGIFSQLAVNIAPSARVQIAMWMLAPIWMSVLSGCFFFRKGLHSWVSLGAANALAYGILALLP